ncbi:hypothetical protein [Flavobacterium silvaticum]|uniref:Uncharacterized protein n=1 Tax=Flavobacterium silvaticum TaxID=1852020 RepID=A0A972FLS8_9FLAO|nr:hypothetical protein [Flavobacterium silvaticum]NMH27992.1 hypothetical protein [Flavobacterium silvaticum]
MYAVILLILTAIVVLVSKKSSMLRNEIFNVENFRQMVQDHKLKDPRPAFSLGRAQLAFWTVIVMGSFLYLMNLGDFPHIITPELNQVSLGLLGIAAGTTLVSKVIDTSQKENQGAAVPQQDMPSKGFLLDIISDEKGVSVHRLQNVIWTVIVGFIYIAHVASKGTLPDGETITPELFALMGISTGAYLGLKLNENKNAPVDATTTNKNTSNEGNGDDDCPPPPPPPVQDFSTASDGDILNTDESDVPPAPTQPSE